MRRLYMQRALQGWFQRALHWQQTRAKLMNAARVLLFGSLARCFAAWLGVTRVQGMKRVVFSQKQVGFGEVSSVERVSKLAWAPASPLPSIYDKSIHPIS